MPVSETERAGSTIYRAISMNRPKFQALKCLLKKLAPIERILLRDRQLTPV
jgi:hypothetical protein